jgi:hypothetical protein
MAVGSRVRKICAFCPLARGVEAPLKAPPPMPRPSGLCHGCTLVLVDTQRSKPPMTPGRNDWKNNSVWRECRSGLGCRAVDGPTARSAGSVRSEVER